MTTESKLETRIESLTAHYNSLVGRIQAEEQEIQRLTNERDSLIEENVELGLSIEPIKEEISRLESLYESYKNSAEVQSERIDRDRKMFEIEKKERTRKLDKEISNKENQIEKLSSEFQRLRESIKELLSKKRSLSQDAQDLQKYVDSLFKQIGTFTKVKTDLEEELDSLRGQRSNYIVGFERERESAERELERVKGEIEENKERINNPLKLLKETEEGLRKMEKRLRIYESRVKKEYQKNLPNINIK